jgi:hypothetical protein
MALITENLALLAFAVILIVSALLTWWIGSYANYEGSNWHTFISILLGLGIFITFLFYYNVVLLQNQQQQLAALEDISRINSSVLSDTLAEIQAASDTIPNFVLSMTPLTNTVCCAGNTGSTGATGTACVIPVEPDPVTPQACTQKMALSYRIFSTWQDTIISTAVLNHDAVSYVSNFLQRANSSQLYAQWVVSKIDFYPATQQFGDLLFEYGLPITTQTPDTYVAAANKLIADARFTKLCN